MPLTVDWSVSINGTDYTSRFNPYVMEIEVTDGSGSDGDSCRITLADDGRLIMPKKGVTIAVSILGVKVFEGILKTPRCTTAKGQGGKMVLNATGHDTEDEGKQSQHFAMEETTLGEYLSGLSKKAGYEIKVDPELAKIKQSWIGSEGRSFLEHAQLLANRYGATLKLSGKQAVLARRGKGKTPGGKDLPTVRAVSPGNIINADIEPYVGTAAVRDVRFDFFNRDKARFEEQKADVRLGIGSSKTARRVLPGKAASREDAEDRAKGAAADSERERGSGTVEIDIEPQARAEGTCIVSGVRQGIDGEYRIESVTHTLTAGDGGGSTTKLTLKQPGDEAGSDKRKAGEGD